MQVIETLESVENGYPIFTIQTRTSNNVELKNPMVEEVKNFIKMVGRGDLLGFTLIGGAGMGKTHIVRNTLDEMQVKYKMYTGHITLAEIYEFLYENCDQLIFFDDVSQCVSYPEIMELLKQCLNVSEYARELNYRSKSVLREGVPNKFEFTGRIIFSFNMMDKKNPNVKAIIDRAPAIDFNYSRSDLFKVLYEIAGSDPEKVKITKHIESVTDATMDVSLRKQQIAFKIYESFKAMYGCDNILWKAQVERIFGKRKESWMKTLVRSLVGDGMISRTELVRQISFKYNQSPRTAQRNIKEYLEIQEIFTNKQKQGVISIKPFGEEVIE